MRSLPPGHAGQARAVRQIARAAPGPRAATAVDRPHSISPDGRILASVTGTGHVSVWNVTDPARAARIATLTGSRDFVQAIAFSPRGNLLAGVCWRDRWNRSSRTFPAR